MEIIKRETIHLSREETRCMDMVFMLMEGLINHANDPEIIRHAEHITGHMSDLYDYIEEEEK